MGDLKGSPVQVQAVVQVPEPEHVVVDHDCGGRCAEQGALLNVFVVAVPLIDLQCSARPWPSRRRLTGTLSASWSWDLLYFKRWRFAVGSWRLAVGAGWWLVAVGGWWGLVVGGGWRLVGVGSWRLAVGGGWWRLAVGDWWSLGPVVKGCPSQKEKNLASQGQPWVTDGGCREPLFIDRKNLSTNNRPVWRRGVPESHGHHPTGRQSSTRGCGYNKSSALRVWRGVGRQRSGAVGGRAPQQSAQQSPTKHRTSGLPRHTHGPIGSKSGSRVRVGKLASRSASNPVHASPLWSPTSATFSDLL